MSKKNNSNTDLSEMNIDLEKKEFKSCPNIRDSQPQETSDVWNTEGHKLGTSPRAASAVAISVLPRRTNNKTPRDVNCEYHEQLLQAIQRREPLDFEMNFEDLEEPNLRIIGRDHPASSEAALAGYRYRTRR